MSEFQFACPACGTQLVPEAPDQLRCPADGAVLRRLAGIWEGLRADRAAYFAQFVKEYETVRQAEGWGDDAPAYYRALPFADSSRRFVRLWQIRSISFRTLIERVVHPLAERLHRPLKVLDLGAGNCWLAYRLAELGHAVAAVDLSLDERDGLGAHRHYPVGLTPVQAEFDHLPLAAGQVDLAVFNASLHYSTDYLATLKEALRVLAPCGLIAVLDSPLYRDASSGARMVRDREAEFQCRYGFPANTLPCQNYLTYARLGELATTLSLRWHISAPSYGWRWTVRLWRARLFARREGAQFRLLVGERLPL